MAQFHHFYSRDADRSDFYEINFIIFIREMLIGQTFTRSTLTLAQFHHFYSRDADVVKAALPRLEEIGLDLNYNGNI